MAPPSATQTPSTPATTPPTQDPAVQAGAEIEVSGEAAVRPEGPELPKESKDSKTKEDKAEKSTKAREYFSNPDHYMGRIRYLGVGQKLDNGLKTFKDHTGHGVGVDIGLKFQLRPRHSLWGGLGYQFHRTSFGLGGGDESHLKTHRVGLTGGYRFSVVPEILSLGAEVFLGPAMLRSSCDMVTEEVDLGGTTESFTSCNQNSATVYNRNAIGYPVHATGFATMLGFNIGVWRDIVSLSATIGKDWGATNKIDDLASGATGYKDPVNDFVVMFGLGIEIPSLASRKTYQKSTYKRSEAKKAEAKKADSNDSPSTAEPTAPSAAGGKSDTGVQATGPQKPTALESIDNYAKHRQGVSAALTKILSIYDKSSKQPGQLSKTLKADADVLGGQEAKNTQLRELAQEAVDQAGLAVLEYEDASLALAAAQAGLADMEEGPEKTQAQERISEAEKTIHYDYENVLKARDNAMGAAGKFNGYADKHDLEIVDFKVERIEAPEGYQPKKKPKAKGKGKAKAKGSNAAEKAKGKSVTPQPEPGPTVEIGGVPADPE